VIVSMKERPSSGHMLGLFLRSQKVSLWLALTIERCCDSVPSGWKLSELVCVTTHSSHLCYRDLPAMFLMMTSYFVQPASRKKGSAQHTFPLIPKENAGKARCTLLSV
jgi:hypothetical protein